MAKKTKKTLKAKKNNVKLKNKMKFLKCSKKAEKYSSKSEIKLCKRKRNKKVTMDELYSIINKAQLGKKRIIFACHLIDIEHVEHVISDSDIKYSKKIMKTQAIFTLSPSERSKCEDSILDQIEIIEDEIPDDDQIF